MLQLLLLVLFWSFAATSLKQDVIGVVDQSRDLFGIGFDFLDTFAYVNFLQSFSTQQELIIIQCGRR
jgi:hypothetical protein